MKRKSKIEEILAGIEAAGFTMSHRTIEFDSATAEILYVQQLTDRTSLSELAIKPLIEFLKRPLNPGEKRTAEYIKNNVLYVDDCKLKKDDSEIQSDILGGMTVILLSTDDAYIAANFKEVKQRSISDPLITYTLRGPRDSFVENLDTNVSLIRNRVKDPKLRIEQFKVGRRSQTSVALFYIEDIANDKVITMMRDRINAIDVDSIGESGELQAFLQNNKWNLFPQMGIVERSDMAGYLLNEGKAVVLVDGSGIALSAPKVFAEFFHSSDDRYDNVYFGLFMRLLRYAAFVIALLASSFFVAISEFHMDALPSRYVIDLAKMRAGTPFPPIIGALMLEFTVELLREALLRVPKQIGSAVGIVTAIVIGEAAISAGIFSPLLLILVCAAVLASFAIPDFLIINPLRIMKIFALIFTGFLGFYGLVLFLCLFLIHLVSVESFGVAYLAPYAPFNRQDFLRTLIFNITFSPTRPNYLRNKDNTRAKKQ